LLTPRLPYSERLGSGDRNGHTGFPFSTKGRLGGGSK
jgi:hypothetical protein